MYLHVHGYFQILRRDLNLATRRKEHAEEALASQKREQKRGMEKMSSVLDARTRSVEDIKRGLSAQNEVLKRSNQVRIGR